MRTGREERTPPRPAMPGRRRRERLTRRVRRYGLQNLAKPRQRVPAAGCASVLCRASPPQAPRFGSPPSPAGGSASPGRISAVRARRSPHLLTGVEWAVLRSRGEQRGGELGQDGQIHVQPDPGQPPHPQREHRPFRALAGRTPVPPPSGRSPSRSTSPSRTPRRRRWPRYSPGPARVTRARSPAAAPPAPGLRLVTGANPGLGV
jgi:hypothetical protein